MSKEKNNGTIFKERLRELSYQYESNTKFAEAMGVSRQTLGHWLNSDRTPDMDMLVKICKALNVSTDYLTGLSDNNSLDSDIQAVSMATGLSTDSIKNIKNLDKTQTEVLNCFFGKNLYFEGFVNSLIELGNAESEYENKTIKSDSNDTASGKITEDGRWMIISVEKALSYYRQLSTQIISDFIKDNIDEIKAVTRKEE